MMRLLGFICFLPLLLSGIAAVAVCVKWILEG